MDERASNEESPWTVVMGMVVVTALLASIALVAAGGWRWFSEFLMSAAPAWVQAIGSVGAIGAAVWLGHRADTQNRRGAFQHFILFKATLIDGLSGGIAAAEAKDRVGFRYGRAHLVEALTLGQAVPLHLLDALDALNATRLRSIAAQAVGVIEAALTKSDQPYRGEDLSDWQFANFGFAERELRALLDQFMKVEQNVRSVDRY